MAASLRVLLVNPPDLDKTEIAIHKRLLGRDFVYPPLGLLYLASHLGHERPAYALRVVDCQAERGDGVPALRRALLEQRPDVVGISVFTNLIVSARGVCRLVRELLPEAVIVAGGPHVSLYAQETMGFPEVDYAVRDEGEGPLVAILDRLAAGERDMTGLPGVLQRRDGSVQDNGPGQLVGDLDRLPLPKRELLKVRSYRMLTARRSHNTTTITSRGCPYRCTFCDVAQHKVRFHSPEWVLRDLEGCLALGIREVHVFDDIFNLDPRRVVRICEGIGRRGLRFDWSFRGRVDRLDPAMLAQARKTGCYRVYLGLESGSPRVLKAMGKSFAPEDIQKGVAAARQAGLEVHGYFMLGFPGETVDEMETTVELALALPLDFVQFSVTTLLPGTRIYEDALASGAVASDVWREQARAPRADFRAPVPSAYGVGEEEVWRIANRAYRRFYHRPRIVWRSLASVRSPSALLRRAKGAFLSLAMTAVRGTPPLDRLGAERACETSPPIVH